MAEKAKKIERLDDKTLASRGAKEYSHCLIYTEARDWMCYDGQRWIENMAYVARQAVGDLLHNLGCTANRARVMSVTAEMADKMRLDEDIVGFDASLDHINAENGVVNLRTGEVVPHVGQHYTYCLTSAYHQGRITGGEWPDFVYDAVGRDEDTYNFIQRAVGYSLTGHTREEKMFYVYGPTRAGKGVFAETITALLAPALARAIEVSTFTINRNHDTDNFDLAPLRSARVLFASESAKGQPLDEATIKHLTGGDPVRCSFKNKTHFEYRPQYKIWITSNHDVLADPHDAALWGRIIRIPFPHSYIGSEDTGLKARLREPEAQEQILAWAVAGAKEWYQYGLQVPEVLMADIHDIQDELDILQEWLEECAEPGEFSSNGQLRANYDKWCKLHGHKPYGATRFGRVLVEKGYVPARRGGQRGFAGISIN